jgi:hypothetical protein
MLSMIWSAIQTANSKNARKRKSSLERRTCCCPSICPSPHTCRAKKKGHPFPLGSRGRNRIVLYTIEFTSFLERSFSSVSINVPSV